MIRSIRDARNSMVDEHATGSTPDSDYLQIINSYGTSRVEYFWKNLLALLILNLITFGILYFTLKVSFNSGATMSVIVAMGLLMNNLNSAYHQILTYQEDKHSMGRVKQALEQLPTTSI